MDVEMMKNEDVENVEDTDVSEGKAKKKGKFLALKIGGVLVLLAAISVGLLPGLAARYTNTADAKDDARVAKFDVSEGGTFTQALIASVEPGTIEWMNDKGEKLDTTTPLIQITNNSEVAVRYSIVVTNVTNNITPLKIGESANASLKKDASLSDESKNTWVYNDTIKGTDSSTQSSTTEVTQDIPLEFKWDVSSDNNNKYMGMVDYIVVEVSATQID
jgi:hypothetical protein